MTNKLEKKYLEISLGSGIYIEISKNMCSGICIDSKVIDNQMISSNKEDLIYLNTEDFKKINTWESSFCYLFNESQIIKKINNFGELF
jgi:hypothetical protein